MTEITAPKRKSLSRSRFAIDPVAFALAMVGGPVLTGFAGAPLLLIPSVATLLGGPIYLLVGVPILLLVLRYRDLSPIEFGGLALVANLTLLGLFWAHSMSAPYAKSENQIAVLVCGLVFAPSWGLVTGMLYNRLRKPFFAQPHSL